MEIRRIHWVEAFPFLRLFRSFGLARNPSRLFLALCAVLSCYALGRLLDAIWLGLDRDLSISFALNDSDAGTLRANWSDDPSLAMRQALRDAMIGDTPLVDYRAPDQESPAKIGPFALLMRTKIRAAETVIQGAWETIGFHGGPNTFIRAAAVGWYGSLYVAKSRPIFCFLFGLGAIAILSFFCGAIARSAAVDSARDEPMSTREALSFAKTRWADFAAAPTFAGVLVVLFTIPLWLFGLVGAIPVLGDLMTGLFLPVGMLLGFVVAMILIGTVFGFHLMWPTIAVEDSDKLDAVSRAYSFVDRRPWHLAFYMFVWLMYMGICLGFVRWLFFLALKVVHASLAWVMTGVGAGNGAVSKIEGYWRMADLADFSATSGYLVPFYGTFPTGDFGLVGDATAMLIKFWVYLAVALFAALALNLWICGSVQMYFLMRRGVDGTDFSEIHAHLPSAAVPIHGDEAAPPVAAQE